MSEQMRAGIRYGVAVLGRRLLDRERGGMTSAVPRFPGMTVAERKALRARWGKPVKVIGAGPWLVPMLRAAGHDPVDLDDDLVDVLAYPSWDAAVAYARANRERFGHRVIGPIETRDGPVCVLDRSSPQHRVCWRWPDGTSLGPVPRG